MSVNISAAVGILEVAICSILVPFAVWKFGGGGLVAFTSTVFLLAVLNVMSIYFRKNLKE